MNLKKIKKAKFSNFSFQSISRFEFFFENWFADAKCAKFVAESVQAMCYQIISSYFNYNSNQTNN